MKGLRHEMISASAGSGKTYELVRRYLHLLALGVDPERIAAMTFTRKAAGEFFNRILRRLGELCDGSDHPDKYFAGMTPLPSQWPDFITITRELLRHMHRLRLGTLDSFFATIAACFPMELGLPVGATVMAEEDAKRALDEALDDLMDRVYRSDNDSEARTLLEAYKLGTYGREEQRCAPKPARLDQIRASTLAGMSGRKCMGARAGDLAKEQQRSHLAQGPAAPGPRDQFARDRRPAKVV